MNLPARSLRTRLLTSYAALALVATALASGAATTLFGRQLDRGARIDLSEAVQRMAEDLEAEAKAAPWRPVEVLMREGGHGHGRPRAGLAVLVDRDGVPLFGPAGGEPGRDFALGTARIPPPRAAGAMAAVDLPRPGDGRVERLAYASAPVPTLGSYLDPPREAYLVLLRPVREVRGQWRTLIQPILIVGLGTLALSSLLAAFLARSITRPIMSVTRASERMADGDFAVRVPVAGDAETARLARAFNAMAERVGEAYARQRDFVANVTHDLRTPLTAMRGFAEALKDGTAATPAQRDAAIDAILASADRMNGLVESLLELARVEGRAAGFAPQAVAARTLLEDAMAACRPRAEARGARFVLAVDGEPTAWVDRTWLVRALVNVIDNALDYGPEGGVVTLEARTIAEGAEPARTRLAVADEGPGIPADQLPRVFERFYRGDPARLAGGTGLGLAIAREIVEAHGGAIRIEAAPGRGTRVVVDVPATDGSRPTRRA